MSPEENDSARAALREVMDLFVAAWTPLSPEEDARIQLSMQRDELLRAISAARITRDDAAIAAAKQALTTFEGIHWPEGVYHP